MSALYATRLQSRFWNCLPYVGFVCVVLGAKLILISSFANQTPYWDQWDSEAAFLYRPWLDGTWDWRNLVAPHNEHRVLTTRLLALAEFEMNGRLWDPILEMQVNACLHIVALLFLLHQLARGLGYNSTTILFIFASSLLVIPYAWENTLAGFQSAFYFELLFSFIFLWTWMYCMPYSTAWWVGLFCGVLSIFSLASGALTVAALILSLLGRRFVDARHFKLPIPGMILLSGILFAALFYTPTIAAHAPLRAHSIHDFAMAVARLIAWPSNNVILGACIIHTPLILYTILKLLKRLPTSVESQWFIFALAAWLLLQFFALAFGRAAAATASRYQDIFVIGLILDGAAILILLKGLRGIARPVMIIGSTAWLLLLGGFFYAMEDTLHKDLGTKFETGARQEEHVRDYLRTSDFSHLTGKPFLHIPYPVPERLKSLLDDKIIQAILPPNILETNGNRAPSFLKKSFTILSTQRFYLIYTGLIVFLIATCGKALFIKHSAVRNAGWHDRRIYSSPQD